LGAARRDIVLSEARDLTAQQGGELSLAFPLLFKLISIPSKKTPIAFSN